ncbi:MAG: choice-of-anchor Q domain-containing protein [Terracidiphilus sp.]
MPLDRLFPPASWALGIGGTGQINLLPFEDVYEPTTTATPLAVDGSGNVYTLDRWGNILKATLAGNTYTVTEIYHWPGEISGIPPPSYLTADSAGNLYVGTVTGNTQKWTPSGSGYTQSKVSNQYGPMAIDGNGVLYIVGGITGNEVFREAPVAGGYSESVVVPSSSLAGASPLNLAVDQKGILYIGTLNDSVIKVDFTVPPATPFTTATDLLTVDGADGTQTRQVVNVGNQPLVLTGVSYPADFPEASGDSNSCTSSTSLAQGQQCDVPIEFYPLHAGNLSENVTITDNTLNVAGTQQSIAVSGTGVSVATHFSVTTTGAVVAGSPFTLTITALDANGNTVAGYNGTVSFASSDPAFVNPGPLTLASGIGHTTVTLKTAGIQTITATDTEDLSLSSSGNFTVAAGAATTLQITGAPTSSYVGTPFNFTVIAKDLYGNQATGYSGTLTFTSTDPHAILPANSTLTGGTGTFSATLLTVGSQTITATDTVNTGLTATAGPIQVSLLNLVVTTAQDDAGLASNCTPQTTPGTGTDAACSLRDALALAATEHGTNISFSSTVFASSPGIVRGSAGTLNIPSNTIVTGPTSGVTIGGANTYTVFTVNAGVSGASLIGLTIVSGSTAGNGGGIANNGSLTVTNSSVLGNGSNGLGGGIFNSGTLTVANSTVAGNQATANGGGIYNQTGATLTLTNSTISTNLVGDFGGGVYSDGTLTTFNTTISGNVAYLVGGGVVFGAGNASLANTIVSGNGAPVAFDGVGNFNDNGGNLPGVSNINLGPLANNGGPTQTMLPLPGSPAICGGIIANASGLASDQRGFSRTTTYGSTSCVDSGAAQTNYALAFTTDPPSSVLAGIWISPAPVVRLTENGMSAVAATNTVSLTDSASLLNGSTSVALSSGSASYYDLLISAASASDSLTATLALTPSLQIPTQSNTFQVLASSLATLTSPTPGSTLTSTDAKFTWSAVAGVSLYDLHLSAIGPGGADLYFSGSVSGTSVIVTGIPANGAIIYARLYSFINGAWQHTDSTYTEATLGQLTVPSPGSTLTGGSIEFTWSRAPGISIYDLHLSTIGPGGADLYASGGVSANSLTVPGIPLNGAKVYARLYSWFNGGW